MRNSEPLAVRSLAASFGFHDPEYRGELARLFDGAGRRRRYLRTSGISLDAFGEVLYDRGITRERLTPDEVYHLLDRVFTPESKPRRKASKRTALAAIDAEAARAKRNRLRKSVCPTCGAIGYSSAAVQLEHCRTAMTRVDLTFHEVMQQTAALGMP